MVTLSVFHIHVEHHKWWTIHIQKWFVEINYRKGKPNVAPNLIFNMKVTDRDGAPCNSIRWSYWRCTVPPPPSKTIMSEWIWVVEILTWVNGTIISWRSWSCLRCFFLARRRRRWKTVGDDTSPVATAAHCVQREELARDSENTWTHGGGGLEKLYRGKGDLCSLSILSFNISAVWQLDPDETINCVEGSKWTLSLLIFWEEIGFGWRDLILVLGLPWSWGTPPTALCNRSAALFWDKNENKTNYHE